MSIMMPGWSSPQARQFPFSRRAVVSRGLREGVRTGSIAGGVVGTAFWPVGGTVFGAAAGALVGLALGSVAGTVLALVDVNEGENSRVRWAAALSCGVAVTLLLQLAGAAGVLAALTGLACGAVSVFGARRVAFGPRAPWRTPRMAHGNSRTSALLDWAAGGVTAGIVSGLVAGAVSSSAAGPRLLIRSALNGSAVGVAPGLFAGLAVGVVVLSFRSRRAFR